MAKVIGFNQEVADNAASGKKVAQRKDSNAKASRNIRFTNDDKGVENKPFYDALRKW